MYARPKINQPPALYHCCFLLQAIAYDLRNKIEMRNALDLENEETLNKAVRDDEYRASGTYEPRVLVTTSSSPSGPCVRFAKELKLIIPNSTRVNRGQTTEKELIELCARESISDIVEVSGSDGQGRPTLLQVCHLPFGPTAHFTISNVVMRADLPEKPAHMSQANPNLIFHAFDATLGLRFQTILKNLFPIASPKTNRVLAFVNDGNDLIHFRHHTFESSSTFRKFKQKDPALDNMTLAEKQALMQRLELDEVGPRFSLLPFKLVRSTLDNREPQIEWTRATFIRKSKPVLSN